LANRALPDVAARSAPQEIERARRNTMIGHDELGAGANPVVVLNDWMSDTSSWDSARAYLDGARFTWTFADLRGYGRSRHIAGAFTVEEAAGDVLELADARGLRQFAVIGHSMSTLVALHLAQHAPDRIERAVVLTPPPPTGFGADDATLAALVGLARADEEVRVDAWRTRYGSRLSEGWARFKAERWSATSEREAVAGYATMFARRGLPDPVAKVRCPVLAVTGEQDREIMRKAAVTKLFAPLCEQLTVTPLAECGHYPMQEAPPLLVAIVERFLGGRHDDSSKVHER
jgi:3-oxoadipate enol-lactonase